MAEQNRGIASHLLTLRIQSSLLTDMLRDIKAEIKERRDEMYVLGLSFEQDPLAEDLLFRQQGLKRQFAVLTEKINQAKQPKKSPAKPSQLEVFYEERMAIRKERESLEGQLRALRLEGAESDEASRKRQELMEQLDQNKATRATLKERHRKSFDEVERMYLSAQTARNTLKMQRRKSFLEILPVVDGVLQAWSFYNADMSPGRFDALKVKLNRLRTLRNRHRKAGREMAILEGDL